MKLKVGEWNIDGVHPVGDWIVSRDIMNDKGELKERAGSNSYHGKFHQACLNVLNHKLTKAEATDLKAVVGVVREESKEIKDMCATVEDLLRQVLAKEANKQ